MSEQILSAAQSATPRTASRKSRLFEFNRSISFTGTLRLGFSAWLIVFGIRELAILLKLTALCSCQDCPATIREILTMEFKQGNRIPSKEELIETPSYHEIERKILPMMREEAIDVDE